MTDLLPTDSHDDRDRGWDLAEHLLKRSRHFEPLSPFAHERVKSRLVASLPNRSRRYRPWLRPLVVAVALLFSATAFGIAWKRLATPHPSPGSSASSMDSGHPTGRGRGGKSHGGKRAPTQGSPLGTPGLPIGVESPTPIAAEMAEDPATAPPASTPGLTGEAEPQRPVAAKVAKHPATAPSTNTLGPLVEAELQRPVVAEVAKAPATALAASTSAARAWPEEPRRFALNSERSWRAPSPGTSPPVSADGPQSASVPPAQPSSSLAWREPPVAPPPLVPDARRVKEEQLLTTAVRALRIAQNPSAALAVLDDYQAHHDHGRLSIEASVLRAEALTALGRKAEALQGLDELDLERVPWAVSRRLERGDLRESIGRWSGALADFDWVLVHAQDAGLLEMAMAGRMRCRQRMGDSSGARGDALEYLRRYPRGRSAQQATDIAGTGSNR